MQSILNPNNARGCSEDLARWLSPSVFKALADPNRVALLARLAQCRGEQTVTDVSGCCSIDISVVSRHLGVLRDAGILEARKRGREVYYRVRTEELTSLLRNLADTLEACCPEGTYGQMEEKE